ncbi:P-loop containing nucleoside triphosphate hydrolase protein [Lipomyces oligophaga]|uniref:P-loop containing nucleoside triphosphate hydrolase protein n=1 Tax=Lipomyces oligophaga TaxID=45792 RepID=UPI0034CED451
MAPEKMVNVDEESEKAERKRLRKLEKLGAREGGDTPKKHKHEKKHKESKEHSEHREHKHEHRKDKKNKNKNPDTIKNEDDSLDTEKSIKKSKKHSSEAAEVKQPKKAKNIDLPSITNSASQTEISSFLKESDITITDPRNENFDPVLSFADIKMDERVLKFLKQFPRPTPIQSASWPFLLAGRDVIGVAETGSGKTMAFGIPAISYLINFSASYKNVSAPVLIISPTRELAVQIHDNLQDLATLVGFKSVCVYGGVSKEDQKHALNGASIIVATPGRLIDLVNDEVIDLGAISYLVLDEADRMLEKGFEQDIKRVMSATDKSKRKTVMFTATWPPSVRDLASSYLSDPVKVMIGDRESELKANSRIEQIVEVVDPREKENRLLQVLKQYIPNPRQHQKDNKILIFALYKKEASRVEQMLTRRGYNIAAIHGDLSQVQRTSALESFKNGTCPLLLATDVAARGLDIPAVKLVINLTFPLTAEDYVHRIGRTGRAGQSGKAITFFTEHEKHLSGALVNVLRGANQRVPESLLKFGGHTKKKEHSVYGAFYKDIDPTKKAKKIVFD